MLNTHELLKYIAARRVGDTDVIDAAFDDPVLLQAELDGYAERHNGQWIGRGYIQPGEQRTLRYILGGTETITGEANQ